MKPAFKEEYYESYESDDYTQEHTYLPNDLLVLLK